MINNQILMRKKKKDKQSNSSQELSNILLIHKSGLLDTVSNPIGTIWMLEVARELGRCY